MPDSWYQLDELGVVDVPAEEVAQILVVAATTLESVPTLERCRTGSVHVGTDLIVLHAIENPDVTSPECSHHIGYEAVPHVRSEVVHAIQVVVEGRTRPFRHERDTFIIANEPAFRRQVGALPAQVRERRRVGDDGTHVDAPLP